MNDCWDYSVCHRLILGVLIKEKRVVAPSVEHYGIAELHRQGL